MRIAVNDYSDTLNALVSHLFKWEPHEIVDWLSPIASDGYAEYFDQEFLRRLGVREVKVPLSDFWPLSGPRWDGLATTASGKLIIVEAKAYIEEMVDYGSKASQKSLESV